MRECSHFRAQYLEGFGFRELCCMHGLGSLTWCFGTHGKSLTWLLKEVPDWAPQSNSRAPCAVQGRFWV